MPAATGTDTGGSIRQPAALTGITGFKPTYGRVSRYGMIAFASSLDQAGTLHVDGRGCGIADAGDGRFRSEGFDFGRDRPVPDYTAALGASLEGKRIGLPAEFFDAGLDAESAACVHPRGDRGAFEKLGATIEEVSLPHIGASVPTYYIVAPAECSSNLSRFDGVRFGHRHEGARRISKSCTS